VNNLSVLNNYTKYADSLQAQTDLHYT